MRLPRLARRPKRQAAPRRSLVPNSRASPASSRGRLAQLRRALGRNRTRLHSIPRSRNLRRARMPHPFQAACQSHLRVHSLCQSPHNLDLQTSVETRRMVSDFLNQYNRFIADSLNRTSRYPPVQPIAQIEEEGQLRRVRRR